MFLFMRLNVWIFGIFWIMIWIFFFYLLLILKVEFKKIYMIFVFEKVNFRKVEVRKKEKEVEKEVVNEILYY